MKMKGKKKKRPSDLVKKKKFLRTAHAALDRVVEVGEIPAKRLEVWEHTALFHHFSSVLNGVRFIRVNVLGTKGGMRMKLKKAMRSAKCGVQPQKMKAFEKIAWNLPKFDGRLIDCVVCPFAGRLMCTRELSIVLDAFQGNCRRPADIWEMLEFLCKYPDAVPEGKTIFGSSRSDKTDPTCKTVFACTRAGKWFAIQPIEGEETIIENRKGFLALMVREV